MRPAGRAWTAAEHTVLMLDAAHGRPERHTAHALQRSLHAIGRKRQALAVTCLTREQRRVLLERLV